MEYSSSISRRQRQRENDDEKRWVESPKGVGVGRSEGGSPYPTTFVQADTSSFKQVVQMLTGSSETAKQAALKGSNWSHSIPPMKPNKKHFKLYERRNSLKNLNIHPLSSPNPHILSPTIPHFPALALSPVTPLIPDPFHPSNTAQAQAQAMKDKPYFFHPSPASTPRDAPPRLLPLFPTTSPRASPSPPASSF